MVANQTDCSMLEDHHQICWLRSTNFVKFTEYVMSAEKIVLVEMFTNMDVPVRTKNNSRQSMDFS